MNILSLKINNYKNISDLHIDIPEKIICLVGNNGAGKTNFLDAIHYLSNTRSYFNHIDQQNIKYNENFFHIEGKFKRLNEINLVKSSFSLERGKVVKLDDKKHKKLSEHFGMFPVVIITPYDIDLILDGSELRRNFIDSVISQYDKDYLHNLINYKKILLHRNSLLKNFAEKNYFDKESLEIWDYKIIKISPEIHKSRMVFYNEFVQIFKEYYLKISGTDEKTDIQFKSDLTEDSIENILNKNIKKDIAFQRTTAGIHKDDLIFTIDNQQLKKMASQGQQKTFLTALKFAQSNYIKRHTGFRPVLLLDDIFDKLDAERVKNVVNLVSDDHFGQIFITHTDKEKLERIISPANVPYSIIEVNKGQFEQML